MDVREKLVKLLDEYFDIGDSYAYNLTRVKSAFACGTMGFDDFEEFDEETVADIADHMIANGVTFATDNNVGSKWIPVTERLPEVAISHNTRWDKSTDSIRVLCACVQADGKKMVKEGYCKVYSDGFVHWKIPGTIHSVTHWQYLPKPPEGE